MKQRTERNRKIFLLVMSTVLFLTTCFYMTNNIQDRTKQKLTGREQEVLPVKMMSFSEKTETEETGFLTGSITVTKRISAEEIETKKRRGEEPVFQFRLDVFDREGKWITRKSRRITFDDGFYSVDQDGYASISFSFYGLDRGTYRVSELNASRYEFDRCGSISSNGTADGNEIVFEIGEASSARDVLPDGSVVFVSRRGFGETFFDRIKLETESFLL